MMTMKLGKVLRWTIGFACAWAAGAARAGTLTMNGWLFGTGHSVSVSAPAYRGAAGGFKGHLAGLGDARFDGQLFEMYCVDLAESLRIDAGTTYTVKMNGAPEPATFTLMAASDVFSAATVERLARLVSHAESDPSFVDSSAESTSLQLAIWNVVYDTDASLDTGSFKDATGYRAGANTLLAASASAPITKDLYVLRSVGNPGRQDQLIWIQRVPEPATLALVGFALAGLGATRRIRRLQR